MVISILYAVLSKFGVGPKFVSWIQLLYSNPCARILTNSTLSEPIKLFRGTRQGYALSLLLFDLALEPLAETIRKHKEIHGYNAGYTSNKISLYADDILLFVTRPLDSIPKVLVTIDLFSSFSGYKVNWGKSQLMPIKCSNLDLLNRLPFRITSEKFSYLGIEVTKSYKSLYEANFVRILDTFKNEVEFWKSLPLSMIGRVNAIKMICLPQLLYLFQNIPVYLNATFFSKIGFSPSPFYLELQEPQDKKGPPL